MLGFDLQHTTAFRPESNGSLERAHAVIKDFLKTQLSREERCNEHWSRYLQGAVFTYNSTTHSSTGVTPYSLTFGKDPPLMNQLEEEPEATYLDLVEQMRVQLQRMHKQAAEAIIASKERTKKTV
ncbi:uncharacterized protein LOC123989077 [Osmia bicornis bicornis]|uniref:uncharacterized protein LOC123989077 n=1 Tax=Osmia bicornis bicornis TaxID=1437191 RepID=UPI001EAEA7EE|nr:uncharacterized protein LOC123989077 [Osmia bicornis bicornis]